MIALALRVNDFLSGMFLGVGIRLIDFKIEIGRVYDGDFQRLIVADEISPDSCRLWDIETGRKLDKDVFRQDLGVLSDAYTEVAQAARRHAAHQRAHPRRAEAGELMKARVHVTLKSGVLDPQGEAVRHALGALGFDGVGEVRIGKVIEVELADTDADGGEGRGRRDVPRSSSPTP